MNKKAALPKGYSLGDEITGGGSYAALEKAGDSIAFEYVGTVDKPKYRKPKEMEPRVQGINLATGEMVILPGWGGFKARMDSAHPKKGDLFLLTCEGIQKGKKGQKFMGCSVRRLKRSGRGR